MTNGPLRRFLAENLGNAPLSKPNFKQIAELAGVGTATVERVLNGRGNVRPQTAMKVIAAAKSLDWPGRMPEQHRGILRIEILLVRPEGSFFVRLSRAFRKIGSILDSSVQLQISFVEEADGPAIARRILSSDRPRAGLILVAPGYPEVIHAVKTVTAAGLPVVQIVSRLLPDVDFVAIDNYSAGRTAGLMMSRMCRKTGPVICLCHGTSYQVHRDRIRGFSDYMDQSRDSGLRQVLTLFCEDNRDLLASRLRIALRQWPDAVGIYNAGGANQGLLDVLSHHQKRVFFVGHELSNATQAALKSGLADVIIDQMPETQARRAVDLILHKIGLTGLSDDNPPIRFNLVTAENA